MGNFKKFNEYVTESNKEIVKYQKEVEKALAKELDNDEIKELINDMVFYDLIIGAYKKKMNPVKFVEDYLEGELE